jgi:hypothetical protein
MGEPPMPKKPVEGEENLPPYLTAIVQSWHNSPELTELELDESALKTYSANEQSMLKECLKKWRDYWKEVKLTGIYFAMIRYFEWRVFYGWQLLHQLNQL